MSDEDSRFDTGDYPETYHEFHDRIMYEEPPVKWQPRKRPGMKAFRCTLCLKKYDEKFCPCGGVVERAL
jgi:hypothetical protein